MGKWRHPGPGFFPFGLAIALILLSLALIFKNWKKDKIPVPFWPERTWLRPLLGVAILIFYALVVERVGFVVTTFIFLVAWMWVIERLRWWTIISISVGTKAKRLIPIGVALEKRDPAIPDVPTFRELGYNVVSVGSVKGVAAPKGTPPEIIAYLADRFKKICDDPEFVKSMKDIGQPVMYLGPDDFGKYLKEGYEEFGKLIKEFNIKLE